VISRIISVMKINFPPSFAKSWKSTLVGLAGTILGVVQGFQAHSFRDLLHNQVFQLALMTAVLGYVSKDANVTGGTSGQPSTPQALKDAHQAPAKAPDAPSKSA
jgi:hypothetical protein